EEKTKIAVVPKNVTSFNKPVIDKLYEEIPNKRDIRKIILIYTEKRNADEHSGILKRNFPFAKVIDFLINKEHPLDEDEIDQYLSSGENIIIFLANLDRGLNTEKSERLANEAVFFAQKNNYQMNVFDIVDEYIATALETGDDYIFAIKQAGNTNSLVAQKENLERFVANNRNELLHYFAVNLDQAKRKKKNIIIPEKTNKNYRLFDRANIYIKVHDKDYVQVYEEIKLNPDEGIIAIIANSAKSIIDSSRGVAGKYFHIYFLTEIEPINGENPEILLNYIEADDGVYVSHKKQSGLLLASERPQNAGELVSKLRAAAQIRDNVKFKDLSFYRFKYVEMQYEN
ncbi:MAG: hypothetical protein IKO06_04955, partial [Alphaproteobacteria bacterium]|nr:hypothetical protein [Alphaproteobacteria bacterium]